MQLTRLKLTLNSAWWGESFVTELRRISESGDRKVRFGSVSTSKPSDGVDPPAAATEEAQDGVPTKDKGSDPATAIEASQENNVDAPEGHSLPIRPATS